MQTDLQKLSPEKQKEMLDQARREMPLYFLEMNAAQDRFIRVKNRHGPSGIGGESGVEAREAHGVMS